MPLATAEAVSPYLVFVENSGKTQSSKIRLTYHLPTIEPSTTLSTHLAILNRRTKL